MPRKSEKDKKTKTVRKARKTYSYDKPGPYGKVGRNVGGALGSYFGPVGSHIGNAVGGLAHYVGKIMGSGDYKVSSNPRVNSLFKGSLTEKNISFGDNGSIRIRNKEFVTDVISSAIANSFYDQKFSINAGNSVTFPWLSQLACNYQTYKVHGVIFEYRSTSGNALNSVNTSLGTVMSAVDYNSMTSGYTSKMEMLNSFGGIDCKPSENFLMGVECDPSKIPVNELYVKGNTFNSTSGDLRFSDLGQLHLASIGCQGTNVNLGELHVIYDIELMLPLTQRNGSCDETDLIILDPSYVNQTNRVIPAYNPYVLSPEYSLLETLAHTSNIGIIILDQSNNTYICFPQNTSGGVYEILIEWQGASTAGVANPSPALAGLTIVSNSYFPTVATTSTNCMYKTVVAVPKRGEYDWGSGLTGNGWPHLALTGGSSTLPATSNGCTVKVSRLNPRVDSQPFNNVYTTKW